MKATLDQRGLTEWPCNSCGVVLPAEKFKRRQQQKATGKAPRHNQCNRCLYVKYTRPEQERKAAVIAAYKLEKGCVDCGYNAHPRALEFDHLPGTTKSFNIGEKIGCYSLAKIWGEIAKCEIVCANCHAIRTEGRRGYVGLAI